jgi:hypothetical protein
LVGRFRGIDILHISKKKRINFMKTLIFAT